MATESIATNIQNVRGHRSVLTWFTFKNARRGSILYGLLAGAMIALQGLAFAATYGTELARHQFATTIATNPTLGILYGEVRNIETPSGYMVYRSMPVFAFVGALWGLFVATRLLRGQEEDGKLELLLTGRSSLTGALTKTLSGLAVCWALAYSICALILILLGMNNKINTSVHTSLFLALAMLAPAAVFMSVGALTSQLGATRRRAVMYGVVPLAGFFVLRSVGNAVSSLHWLKYLTPFGWVDKLHPVTGSDWRWFIPLAIVCLVSSVLAIYFSRQRDFGVSIVADNPHSKAKLKLLGGPMGLAFRLTRTSLFGWLFTTVAVSGLIASLANTATKALSDSESLTKAVGKLAGNTNALGLAFISLSGFFIALILMIATTSGIGRMRDDEAKGYLDNFLVGGVSRTSWIVKRVVLILISSAVICTAANLVCWLAAYLQNISLSGSALIFGGLNYLAPVILMLGIGILLLGLKPRIASFALYAWIVWSFLVEMVGSVVNFKQYILNTSLLRQITLVPATQPNWKSFLFVSSIGVAAFVVGLTLFGRRDLQSE